MEKTIHFKRGQTYSHKNFVIKSTHLPPIPLHASKECERKAGKNPEKFSLGGWLPRKENSPDRVEECEQE